MFESVLIANRGEIACRIIRTCRRLGIRTIAVYSAADAGALHVRSADESHPIGPAEARHSYLRPEAIIAAALAHGASAIHPGYGFLSERVELAELCAANGITWIGPSPRCIAAMGSKIESKRLAEAAGVPCVPGYHGDDQAPARLLREATSIGFPVLIKASAGGGGRGMRRVDDGDGFVEALATSRAEAMAAFGDDRVLLEKFIRRPRHLEAQLAGDRHGNLVHLFERECSIQRSYQKLVEEAPAPHLSDAVRTMLLEAAIRLGRAIGYDSLGTVEFILEAGGSEPYFLEMNTRLQVEHPVTEMITGLDLVELQLRIASGETLPVTQAQVTGQGAAIELRLNAEDPAAGYRPQIGRVSAYRMPEGAGLRVDSGIDVGSEVTPFYDSLLLKLIAWGPDRAAARRRLDAALCHTVLLGPGTNQAFLRDVIRHPDFAGVLTTQFIAECFPDGWRREPPDEAILGGAAVAMAASCQAAAPGPWGSLAGFRVGARAGLPGRTRFLVCPPDLEPVTVDVVAGADGLRAMQGGRRLDDPVLAGRLDDPVLAGRLDDPVLAGLHVADDSVALVSDGVPWVFAVAPLVQVLARTSETIQTAASDIVTAMPGVIAQVRAAPGQAVRRGEVLIVQEAMKLMLSLPAAMDGVVRAVNCVAGQVVGSGAVLVQIDPGAN